VGASGSLRQQTRRVEVNLIRNPGVKRLVEVLVIGKTEPFPETCPEVGSVVEGADVKVMVLERLLITTESRGFLIEIPYSFTQ
jgi:hypothetical protein